MDEHWCPRAEGLEAVFGFIDGHDTMMAGACAHCCVNYMLYKGLVSRRRERTLFICTNMWSECQIVQGRNTDITEWMCDCSLKPAAKLIGTSGRAVHVILCHTSCIHRRNADPGFITARFSDIQMAFMGQSVIPFPLPKYRPRNSLRQGIELRRFPCQALSPLPHKSWVDQLVARPYPIQSGSAQAPR